MHEILPGTSMLCYSCTVLLSYTSRFFFLLVVDTKHTMGVLSPGRVLVAMMIQAHFVLFFCRFKYCSLCYRLLLYYCTTDFRPDLSTKIIKKFHHMRKTSFHRFALLSTGQGCAHWSIDSAWYMVPSIRRGKMNK